jgi:wyosine [tRNA(Phe)-imidazoG37] synthetase (radical SAM superfamily)
MSTSWILICSAKSRPKSAGISCCAVKIVGLGEPALHPQLGELMYHLKNFRIPTAVYTNGELFRAFTTEEIISWGLELVIVSVDGLDPDS